ncbi:MAG: CBS domain-containing protein, partial [Bellilinea sp.]
MTVRACMKQKVISVQQDTTLEMAAAVIREHHIGTLPVVDHDRKLVGMLRLEN